MRARLLGVAVSGFSDEAPVQLGLFGDESGRARPEESELSRVRDELRERFGEAAVRYGRDLRFDGRTSDTQPMGKQRY